MQVETEHISISENTVWPEKHSKSYFHDGTLFFYSLGPTELFFVWPLYLLFVPLTFYSIGFQMDKVPMDVYQHF